MQSRRRVRCFYELAKEVLTDAAPGLVFQHAPVYQPLQHAIGNWTLGTVNLWPVLCDGFQFRKSIGNNNAAHARQFEHAAIIVGIAGHHDIVMGQSELAAEPCQGSPLVDTVGENVEIAVAGID